MKIKVIHNEEAHEAALRDLEKRMSADPRAGSPQFEELELLALVIKDYEDQRHPIGPPDPVEAIKFRLEQQGQSRSDLVTCFGTRARVSEVLNRKRSLSLAMIRSLHRHFGIPAEILIRESMTGHQKISPRSDIQKKARRTVR